MRMNQKGVNMKEITIRNIKPEEVDQVASLIAAGYNDDVFFKWVVEKEEDRHKVVRDYYKTYLNAAGCVAHVAENISRKIIGATVWLPHDVDESLYDDINAVVGTYANHFQAVADKSHDNEPTERPFYQLVGFVVQKDMQGKGLGRQLLKYYLDELDQVGMPTYLEASTPYHGTGVYGKFGYQSFGQIMSFDDIVYLYPLYRPAKGGLE